MAVKARAKIPGYEIQQKLGEGTTAVVYEATQIRTGRAVALKILRDELLSDPAARSRFHREARALMCVTHPNVAAVFDYSGPEADYAFIAMELYDGKSLRALIEERGRLPDAQAAAVFVQVFAALDAAHAESLLHRDLSVSNIIVTSSGRTIVTDFGLVASVAGARSGETFATKAANLVGTPLYYAPELLLSGQYSESTDLYAAGVCLTYALLGRPPTDPSDMAKLLAAVIDGKLKRVVDSGVTVDLPLATLADALTAPATNKRPPRAQDAMRALAAWLQMLGVHAEEAIATWLTPNTETLRLNETAAMTDELVGVRVASGGRFEAHQLIGEGGMARVFLGHDNRLNRAVAIKLMHDDDPIARKRFHREARALGRIRHPNVMEVIDYSGADAKLPYIVLELVDGATLERVVHGKPMDEAAALCVALAICDGLAAVHHEGFIHRDVKPENVFVDRLGRVLLADFGIVRSERGDQTGTFVSRNTAAVGSPLFASPEQIFTPDSAGPKSDLFSLGSLLFFLLTRQAPVSDAGVSEALRDLNDGSMRKLPDTFSPDVRHLISDLHKHEPRKRPGSAAEVAAQVRAMLAKRKIIDPRARLRQFLDLDFGSQTFETSALTAVATKIGAKTDAQLRRTDVNDTAEQKRKRNRALPFIALGCAGVLGLALFLSLPVRHDVESATPPVPAPQQPAAELPVPAPTELPVPAPTELPAPIEVDPAPKPAVRAAEQGPATLRFFTKPWAKITIGERDYGTTPKFNTVELPPGRYVVRFENPAYKTMEKKIELKGGERREVHVTLEKP